MNHKLIIFPILALTAAVFASPAAEAPTSTSSFTQAAKQMPHGRFQDVLEDAATSAKASDIESAEAKLSALNVGEPYTAFWHLETAQKLMQMTESIVRTGKNDDAVHAAVQLTLQHLDRAGALAKESRAHAQAKAAAGAIYYRYLGDITSAISSYREAAKLDPDDPGIQQALTRLVSTQAKLRARLRSQKP